MPVRHPNLPRITPLSAEINRRCCGLNWNTMEGVVKSPPQIEGTFSRSRRSGLFSCSPYLPLLRHGLEVDILRPVHTGPGAQDLGLEKRPDKPLKGQAVVAEKAGHSDGGGCQDAQPTGGLLAHNAFEQEVNTPPPPPARGGNREIAGWTGRKRSSPGAGGLPLEF